MGLNSGLTSLQQQPKPLYADPQLLENFKSVETAMAVFNFKRFLLKLGHAFEMFNSHRKSPEKTFSHSLIGKFSPVNEKFCTKFPCLL